MRSFQKLENFPSWSPASSLKSVRFAELKIQQILAWKEKSFLYFDSDDVDVNDDDDSDNDNVGTVPLHNEDIKKRTPPS